MNDVCACPAGEERPRVFFLITSTSTGGAEILLERLAPLLAAHVDFQVMSLRPVGDVGRRMQEAGYEVASAGMAAKWDVRGLWRVAERVRCFRPHVIHAHLFHADLVARTVGRSVGRCFVVSTVHNERLERPWEHTLMRLTDAFTEVDICIGRRVAEAMIARRAVSAGKVRIIPNGVDVHTFKPRGKNATPPWQTWGFSLPCLIFGFVGRLEPQKDLPNLLAASSLLRAQGVRFGVVIVGGGFLEADIRAQVRSLGLGEYVQMAGKRVDMSHVMASFDAFVLPSSYEGLPLVLLEAMACGLPVVATRVGAVPELLGGRAGGILVDPRDGKALAAGMRELMSNPEEARRMGRRNRAVVRRDYSIEVNAHQLCSLYRWLASSLAARERR